MKEQVKAQSLIVFVMLTSFLLGWHMRGDKIYDTMYEQDHNNPMIQKLAEKINGK